MDLVSEYADLYADSISFFDTEEYVKSLSDYDLLILD